MTEIGRIRTEIRTSSALRARRASSSRGPAPTSARRASARSAAARIGCTLGVPRRLASLPVKVSAEDARRFLVARQMLAPARSLQGGHDGALEVFRRWGSVQFDPIPVAGRSHDLVLHARVAGYEPSWTEQLWERREIFEAYNKGLSFVLTEEYPWFRGQMHPGPPRILAANREVADRVVERIRSDGPLSALDFDRERGALLDWFGVPTNVVRGVLEALAFTGELGLARREGSRRYYD